MFLLIQTNWWYAQTFLYFNTSHVSINLRLLPETGILERISIHLMFLLIIQIHLKGVFPLFISIHLMFLLIGHSNRVRRSEAISIHLMFLLISGQRMHYRIKSNYFNTSHVSINRKSGGQDHSRRNFNTSHVSINHRFFKADCSILYISIHLMFLLIESEEII